MDEDDFRRWSQRAAEWGADYRAGLRDRRVRAATLPGEIVAAIDPGPPEHGEDMQSIMAAFETTIVPGMTHWQHPRFFAYFPANAAPASVVAEYLVSAMAAQCMLWQTSPAATELELVVVDWMRQAFGLPATFKGVIQDSASTATLAAIVTMRERALSWQGNRRGLAASPQVRVYASSEVHSSIDRAIWISGIGEQNLVRIPTAGPLRAMDVDRLEATIAADLDAGMIPAGIVACVGGTSTGSTDDVAAIVPIARRHGLYLHVDAAWAGAAMICDEFRTLWAGVEEADSIVVNPHKWLGAQFDCSTHFLREPETLLRTLAIRPDYLATLGQGPVVDFSEWSVPLGRRFRALKLWFLLRAYGLERLRAMIRNHVVWSGELARRIAAEPDFVVVTEPVLSLFSFRHVPAGVADIDAHNRALIEAINDDGRIYLTQTRVDGITAIRFQAGQFDCTREDVDAAYDVILELARRQKTA